MNNHTTCETLAAIVIHIRAISTIPVSLFGYKVRSGARPKALCDARVAWDTQIPVASATCARCVNIYTAQSEA